MKTKSVVILLLITVLTICSCKLEPELSGEAEVVAQVGTKAATSISNVYNENGSYDGLTVTYYGNSVYFNYSDASIELDLSDVSLGTKTVTINGQSIINYEDYPSIYPATQTFNISFEYDGIEHTLEAKVRVTGVSSISVTGIKVDGTSYKDQSK